MGGGNSALFPMTEAERRKLPYRKNVGLAVVNSTGRVFAGQRLDSDYDAWQMPQGGIDAGEGPYEAALRELWEETGIVSTLVECVAESGDWLRYDFPTDLAAKLWKGGYRGQEQKWFLLRFLGTDSQINIVTEHPEFSDWRWMEPNDLVTKIVPFKRDIYRKVFDEFGRFLR